MKFELFFFIGLFICFGCETNTSESRTELVKNRDVIYKESQVNEFDSFELFYAYAGLGSGMGSMQPTFRVNGTNYAYTKEQNSFYGNAHIQPENICNGKIRASSIDSILSIVKVIKDTLVYNTNTGIMSGGIHNIVVSYQKINVNFKLHNATDSNAQKIVDILNSNIPKIEPKLWLSTDF